MCGDGSGLKASNTGALKNIIDPQLDPNRSAKIEILKRLNKSPYRDRKDRNPERIPGTCEWFVAHELFRDWHESKSSTMLWVSADPGCGKSVLVKYLVDSILVTAESRTMCYFFFKDDFEDQRSAVSALCCILHQIFKQKRILLSENIFEQFEIEGEKLTSSFSELWAILLSAVNDKNAGEIICLLDAIDKCEPMIRLIPSKINRQRVMMPDAKRFRRRYVLRGQESDMSNVEKGGKEKSRSYKKSTCEQCLPS
jgi:hypothetical protein